MRDKALSDLEPIRAHLDKLLKLRDVSVDEDDDESHKNLSQQERDHIRELQHTRQSYVYSKGVDMSLTVSIRELLLILHQSWFFEGDFRHVQKEADAESRSCCDRERFCLTDGIVNCYTQAETVRQEILARPLRIANTSVGMVESKLAEPASTLRLNELQTKETKRKAGILSEEPIQQSNDLLEIMNEK